MTGSHFHPYFCLHTAPKFGNAQLIKGPPEKQLTENYVSLELNMSRILDPSQGEIKDVGLLVCINREDNKRCKGKGCMLGFLGKPHLLKDHFLEDIGLGSLPLGSKVHIFLEPKGICVSSLIHLFVNLIFKVLELMWKNSAQPWWCWLKDSLWLICWFVNSKMFKCNRGYHSYAEP